MKRRILDSHVHIWDFDHAEYKWLEGDKTILNRSYNISELSHQISSIGVTNGVLVQAANNIEDTLLNLEVAEKTYWIDGVVGWLPLLLPDKVNEILENGYGRNLYFKGSRHLIHNEINHEWLLQDTVLESLKLLSEKNIPFDVVGVNTYHFKTALKVSEKIPKLKMVFDHLNQPPIIENERFGIWGELVREASNNSNLFGKISGLGSTASGNTGKNWNKNDIKPYIMFTLEHFGINRCFCGGDWPVALLAGEYDTAWDAYLSIIEEEFSEDEQYSILYRNGVNFYHLEIEDK